MPTKSKPAAPPTKPKPKPLPARTAAASSKTPRTRSTAPPAVKRAATAKVAPEAPAAAAAQVPASKAGKKPPKQRPALVRDSFTMPESDFALIAQLKSTAMGARRAAKKSELLRAGLHLLATLEGKALAAALDRLEAVKTGRPKKRN